MSTNAPVLHAVTTINLGDPASPSIINTPFTDVVTNLTNIINYLTNDGSGSGIDSDFLDGQHGSYYTNASNLATGTVPAAVFSDTSHGARAGGTLHAAATTSTAGFLSAADKTKLDGIATGANLYVLPNASASVLGGIKVGSRLSIDGTGTLSAADQTYTLPPATISTLGGIKVGSLLSVDVNGVLSANSQTDNNFTNALLSKLNGIATNANLYVLPTATASVLGGVMVGSYLTITSGVLAVNISNIALLNAANVFTANQTAPDFITTSDRDLKTNINEVSPALSYDFTNLTLYSWDWNEKARMKGHSIGTMADEMAQIIPDAVSYDENGKPVGINYGKAAFILAMYLKEKMGV
jgi:hypothetical protein